MAKNDENKAVQTPPETENKEINVELKELLEAAKAEAEKIINDAKKVADDIKNAAQTSKAKNIVVLQNTSDNEDLVEVELFKDSGKYKDDVFVAVNGERIQIARGEKVLIKKKFFKVLEASRKQDIATARFIQEKTNEFALESAKRNI